MNTQKKNLALLELIIVILFFALSAVVLTQVFVKAKAMGSLAEARTLGLVAAQDVAERLKAAPNDIDNILHGWTSNGTVYTAGFDKNMNLSAQNPVYSANVSVLPQKEEAGIIYQINVDITRVFDGKNIVDIETGSYVPAEADN